MFYIPGDFLWFDWPANNDCFIKCETNIVQMIQNINQSYQDYIVCTRDGRR